MLVTADSFSVYIRLDPLCPPMFEVVSCDNATVVGIGSVIGTLLHVCMWSALSAHMISYKIGKGRCQLLCGTLCQRPEF